MLRLCGAGTLLRGVGRCGGQKRSCGRGSLEERGIQWEERLPWGGGLNGNAVAQVFCREDTGAGRRGFFEEVLDAWAVSEVSLAGCEGARFFHWRKIGVIISFCLPWGR